MKEKKYKIMFGVIKKCFVVLLMDIIMDIIIQSVCN